MKEPEIFSGWSKHTSTSGHRFSIYYRYIYNQCVISNIDKISAYNVLICSIIDKSQYKLVKKFICKCIYDLKLKINQIWFRSREKEMSIGDSLSALNMVRSLCTVLVRDIMKVKRWNKTGLSSSSTDYVILIYDLPGRNLLYSISIKSGRLRTFNTYLKTVSRFGYAHLNVHAICLLS